MILPFAAPHRSQDREKDQEALLARYERSDDPEPTDDEYLEEAPEPHPVHQRRPRFLGGSGRRPRFMRGMICRRLVYLLLLCLFVLVCAVGFIAKIVVTNLLAGRSRRHSGGLGTDDCLDDVKWTSSNFSDADSLYNARATFDIPMLAAQITFFSEGAYQSGQFEIAQDLDADSEHATIDIHASYRDPKSMSEAKICRLHPMEDTWGLGIFTPHWWNPINDRNLNLRVVLHLPAAPPGTPLKINQLFSDMPRFSHSLPNLADTAYFDLINLKTKDAYIYVGSLSGNYIRLQTSNAPIRGTVDVSTWMSADTSNAPIDIFATLTSKGVELTPNPDLLRPTWANGPTSLWLQSSNGRVDSTVSLRSNSSSATRGSYNVHTETTKAPLKLTFVDAPLDSALDVYAHTSLAPVEVSMHKTFEGRFDVASTMFFRPEVMWNPISDPEGLGRKRRVDIWSAGGSSVVRGWAAWDANHEYQGRVDVGTSISTARLELL